MLVVQDDGLGQGKPIEPPTVGAPHHQALWETIAAALRRAILLGELPAGLHLEEPALAGKFRVSRIPVREAIVRLSHEGLVRLEPRRGAFVIGVTEQGVADLYECRALIERRAIRRAAERIDGAGLARLQALVDGMDAAVRRGEPQLTVEPDVAFHRELVRLADNRFLLVAWEPCAGLVTALLGITNTTYRDMPAAVAGHQALIGALARREADAAERLLDEHLWRGEQTMRATLRRASAERDATKDQATLKDGSRL